MIDYEEEILEYLKEAYEDESFFPSETYGWIRFYRIAKDLKILKPKIAKSCQKLKRKKYIETNPPNSDFIVDKPLIKITSNGIKYLEKFIEKFIDAWHFELKNEENSNLARSWQETDVHPHVRLEVENETPSTIRAKVYGRTSLLYSKWIQLSQQTVVYYTFYEYYHEQYNLGKAERGYFWLRGSGFWCIKDISIRGNSVKVWLLKS